MDIIQKQNAQIADLQTNLRWFEEQFHLARHKQYGASSERTVQQQGELFNEAEAIAEAGPVEEEIKQTITCERKKPGRKPVPKDLPIERVAYRLPEEEQICDSCGGPMHEMSEELPHEVKLIPAQVKMFQHARYVYGCRNCEKNGIRCRSRQPKHRSRS
jgi:transposase